MPSHKLLVLVRHSPYGSSLARSSLELALTSATFDMATGVLFMGEGVLHLLPEQNSSAIGVRNIASLIASFGLYELDNLYADQAAVRQFNLDCTQLPENLQHMNSDAIRHLIDQYDQVLGF